MSVIDSLFWMIF